MARPAYLLAMKCAAMRLGEEFHDLDDVRYLLRYLNITSVEEALEVVTRYFDAERLPQDPPRPGGAVAGLSPALGVPSSCRTTWRPLGLRGAKRRLTRSAVGERHSRP